MTTGRCAALAGVLAMGILAGCGDNKSCDTPAINHAPSSCTLAPETPVSVNVRWCNCGAAVTCDVSFDSGSYLLTPKLTSCDESCPSNPSDCPLDSVPCQFTTQGAGTYPVSIISGFGGVREATFTVAAGGDTSCGP